MARALLIRDLEQNGGLLERLKTLLSELEERAFAHGYLQIFIVAHAQGGVGAGMFGDLSVLLSRLCAKMFPCFLRA